MKVFRSSKIDGYITLEMQQINYFARTVKIEPIAWCVGVDMFNRIGIPLTADVKRKSARRKIQKKKIYNKNQNDWKI